MTLSYKKATETSNLNLCKILGSHGSERSVIFWDVAQYILTEIYRRFKRSQYQFSVKEFYILKMKASCCSETSVNFCQTIWRHIPQEVVFSINVFNMTMCRHVDMNTSEQSYSQCSLLPFYMDCVPGVVVPTSAWQHSLNSFNPFNPELNPICYLLALLGAHHFLHVSRIRVKLLTFRLLMSYIYGAPILDVSTSHTTQHSR